MRNDISPVQIVEHDNQPDADSHAILVARDEVICWTERVSSGRYGALHRNTHSAIMLVVAGGPAEVLDSTDRLYSRSLVTAGQLVRGDQLPSPYRLRNLGDRALIVMAVEPNAQR